jgi:hypothetical protein
MPKFNPKRYCPKVNIAKEPKPTVKIPAAMEFSSAKNTIAAPLKTKHKAVLNCIAAKVGWIWVMADTPAHYPDITTKPRTIIMLAGIIGFKF